MVDAELDGAPEHGAGGVGVARRAEHAGAGELHGAEADPVDGLVAEVGGLGHGRQRSASVDGRTRRASILGLAPPPTGRRRSSPSSCARSRERTSPETVGLEAGGRRRTPGLRREEVSQLAGVGLSWYTWLEQGRDITPSASVLDALARVLDLDPAERTHLFDLAGVALPPPAGDYPTRGAGGARRRRRGAGAQPRLPAGPAHRRAGLEPRRDAA